MDTKVEQLKEDNNEDEYYSGNSKKRQKKSYPLSCKILILITIISCLANIYFIYRSFSIKHFPGFKEFAESRFSGGLFLLSQLNKKKLMLY